MTVQLDVFQIPPHRQAVTVMCHPIEHPAHIQSHMTLPPDPTLFLAHCKAHKTRNTRPTLQRAKNANAQPAR